MSRFKVGDKVRCIEKTAMGAVVGEVYTVARLDNTTIILSEMNECSHHMVTRFELIKETDMDSKKIAEAIEALPVCSDGKSKVKDLIKALGFDVGPKHPTVVKGQIYETTSSTRYLVINVYGSQCDVYGLDNKDFTTGLSDISKSWKHTANSLDEYYAQKRD